MDDLLIRPLAPADYELVIPVVNDWWGGRNMRDMLPKLFFVHFCRTSFVAEQRGQVAGFLVGFMSQCRPKEAYVHFVGVHPRHRRSGLGKILYDCFFAEVGKLGCRQVRCVTSPLNKTSIAFHQAMGFEVEQTEKEMDGASFAADYDGPGEHRVLFLKALQS